MADVFTDQARQALIDAHAAIAAEVQKVVEHFAAADAAMGGILAALDLSDANLPAAAIGNPDLFGPYLDAIWQLAPSADYASTFRRMEHVHQTMAGAVVPLYSMPWGNPEGGQDPPCRPQGEDRRRSSEGTARRGVQGPSSSGG